MLDSVHLYVMSNYCLLVIFKAKRLIKKICNYYCILRKRTEIDNSLFIIIFSVLIIFILRPTGRFYVVKMLNGNISKNISMEIYYYYLYS